MSQEYTLVQWLEAVLITTSKTLSEDQLLALWPMEQKPSLSEIRQALFDLTQHCSDRAIELQEVASGYRLQIKSVLAPGLAKVYEEKPGRYSRALFETLALIAYRQPITRGEIEEIRGVSVSSSIFKTLQEDREWVRVVGHRAVPGRPALYATTKAFLDYFNLRHLEELPLLPELNFKEEDDEHNVGSIVDAQLSLQLVTGRGNEDSACENLSESELEHAES